MQGPNPNASSQVRVGSAAMRMKSEQERAAGTGRMVQEEGEKGYKKDEEREEW